MKNSQSMTKKKEILEKVKYFNENFPETELNYILENFDEFKNELIESLEFVAKNDREKIGQVGWPRNSDTVNLYI